MTGSGAGSRTDPARGACPARPARARVLFIDDDANLGKLARIMLERLGCEVTIATSGPAGLQLVLDRPERFDLVLTDQVMPGMDGVHCIPVLAARIHAVRPDLPVVLCTGGNQHDEHRARRAGIRAILLKPITSRDLAALLDRLLLPAA